MMIWVTCFNESWIRKQNSIANEWLVREYVDVASESKAFRHELSIDLDT